MWVCLSMCTVSFIITYNLSPKSTHIWIPFVKLSSGCVHVSLRLNGTHVWNRLSEYHFAWLYTGKLVCVYRTLEKYQDENNVIKWMNLKLFGRYCQKRWQTRTYIHIGSNVQTLPKYFRLSSHNKRKLLILLMNTVHTLCPPEISEISANSFRFKMTSGYNQPIYMKLFHRFHHFNEQMRTVSFLIN